MDMAKVKISANLILQFAVNNLTEPGYPRPLHAGYGVKMNRPAPFPGWMS